jgi:hypothetical protein
MVRSNSPSLAIPLDVILPQIISEGLCEGDACDLALDDNLVKSHFRAHQIFYLQSFARNKFRKELSIKAIARVFEIQLKDVRNALGNGDAIPKRRGEHPALEDDTEKRLLEWTTKNAQNHACVNRTEVLHDCRETLSAAVTEGWVDSFLIRHHTELFETTRRPQENPRLEIPRSCLDTMGECLRQPVQDCCADLVFNLDEVGISEWEDRVARKVIVPVSMSGETIHHGVHRNLKHISVVRKLFILMGFPFSGKLKIPLVNSPRKLMNKVEIWDSPGENWRGK